MFRDDDAARTARAGALIDEIADLEREKLARTLSEQRDAERLETAKRELAELHAGDPADAKPVVTPKPEALARIALAHLAVFIATASLAYVGYALVVA